jgi:hypothetical protein
VSVSKLMTAVEHIKAAQTAKLVDEDGRAMKLKLLPALDFDRLDALQKQVRQPLPEELRSVLSYCSGIEECLDGIDFTGDGMEFEAKEIFPNGLPIAGDEFGNFWVLDITPETTQAAPVYFSCHDPPVVLYQSPDLASFLSETFRLYTSPYKSSIDDVADDKLFNVWRKNPGVIEQAAAAASPDAVMRSFASGLPAHFQIVDLRNAALGMGFSWGRYGARTEVRRYGYERVFAYAKPTSTGFFAKLFGR